MSAIGLGFSFVFLFVWEQLQAVRLGYRLERARVQIQAQEEKNAFLRFELERLHSPQWLARAARQRLKMSPPSPDALIVLEGRAARPASRPGTERLLSRLFSTSRG